MNILITGGTSGVGRAITEMFLQNPENTVTITYHSNNAEALSMKERYKNLEILHCDFTNRVSVESLIAGIPGIRPDVLVNNAYSNLEQMHFVKTTEEMWLKDFEVNVLPVLSISKECIKLFKKNKFGRIINILSSAILGIPTIGYSVYAANKSYLLSMSKSWASENARFNITSNCISPSFMKTNLTASIDDRIIEGLEQAHPLNSLLLPSEVARATLFLAQSAVDINGINLPINAGV